MAEEGLIIRLKADTTGVENAFVKVAASTKEVVAAFAKVDAGAQKSGASLATITGISSKVSKETSAMVKASALAGGSLDKISKSSNTATFALGNLSRVAQDAPYGFIGIANNLNPLLESFQRLRAESGSTGGALKALGGSLMGAGGIGLALGVVSSLLVVFGDKLFKSKSAAESATEANKKATEALEDYVEGLNAVDRANVKGLQSAQGQLQSLNTLYAASQNQNLSLEERRKAVDLLQEQYPKYFGNIKDEIVLAGGAKSAYDKLTTSIIASARARAIGDILVENEKKLVVLENQRTEALQRQLAAQEKIDRTSKVRGVGIGQDVFQAEALAQGELRDATNQTSEALRAQNVIKAENLKLSKAQADIVQKNGVGSLDPNSFKDKVKAPKATPKDKNEAYEFLYEFLPFNPDGKLKPENRAKLLDAADKFSKEFGNILEGADFRVQPGVVNDDDVIEVAKDFWAKLKAGVLNLKPVKLIDDISVQPPEIKFTSEPNLNGLKKAFEGLDNLGPLLNSTDRERVQILQKYTNLFRRVGMELPKIVKDEMGKPINIDNVGNINLAPAFERILQPVQAFKTSLDRLIQDIAIEGFSSLGEALGSALSGVDTGTVFQKLFSFIGGSIADLGKQMIALSPVVAALKVAIKTLNPAILLPAGIGLVAIGTVLKNARPKGFADGGVIYGPTLGLVGEYAGASNNPEVIAPLNKLKDILGDVGGGNMIVQGELVGRGDSLIAVITRASKRQGRNF